jgi:hypothetical protein
MNLGLYGVRGVVTSASTLVDVNVTNNFAG